MKKHEKLLTAAGSVVVVLFSGSVLFHFIEGWGYFDSLYFSLITLTTVGYGDFSPATTLGKGVAMAYIFFGIGILLSFVNILTDHNAEKTARKVKKKELKHSAVRTNKKA